MQTTSTERERGSKINREDKRKRERGVKERDGSERDRG